jgi:cytochrome c554/c'-like protein
VSGTSVTCSRLTLLAALALLVAGTASAQTMTRCASCHFANMGQTPAPDRLAEWQQSAHARHVVGCNDCHGGDPWTVVPADAHRGVLSPMHPMSSVNGANLTRTCSRCHQATAQAFAGTLHQTLVESGDRRAPDCTTCHGSMRDSVPSPAALESKCAGCHPAGSARGAYPSLMRAAVEELNEQRARADALDDAVARVPEHSRRVELLVNLYKVRKGLKESLASVHAFDVQRVNEGVAAARRDLDAVARAAAASATEADR